MEIWSSIFWLALAEIIWVNILLSGDNAVVIALAARSLPPTQQKQAVVIGSAAAIVLRIVLTLVAAQMLALPWLKLVGAILLVYIGVSLLLENDEKDDGTVGVSGGMLAAIRTILIADLVMSLDNVIAVAAAAQGNTVLLIAGLAISIPLVIFGSTLLLRFIERFPMLVWFGAALLGFIAGELLVEDPALTLQVGTLEATIHLSHHNLALVCGVIGAVLVVALGKLMNLRQRSAQGAA
jgi:YjbE family integral membrane protein